MVYRYLRLSKEGWTLRRRTSLLLAAGVCLALTVASPAYAQEPTIVTDITFPEEGAPFATFAATAISACWWRERTSPKRSPERSLSKSGFPRRGRAWL